MREADRLFSKVVTAGGRCRMCWLPCRPDCAHVFEKAWAPAARWDEANAVPLCRACHAWGHANKGEFLAWAESVVGGREFERVRKLARSTEKADPFAAVERLRRLAG